MRYLPLTQTDRSDMLAVIGAASIDDLFADVPSAALLDAPIPGLPHHERCDCELCERPKNNPEESGGSTGFAVVVRS